MTDKRTKIREALRAVGVREEALPTAEAEFTPSEAGTLAGQKAWTFDGSTTTLTKHARRYAEGHAFLVSAEPRRAPTIDDKFAPRYLDGTRIPTDQLSPEELFDIQAQVDAEKARIERGEQPEHVPTKSAAEARAELRAEALEHLEQEESKRRASAGGEGNRVSKPSRVISGVGGLTPDELFDQAGEVK